MTIHVLVETATTPTDIRIVQAFTHDRYEKMGWCEKQPDGLLRHHETFDFLPDGMLNPNTEVVFVRDRLGTMIGTCSITVDSEDGLPTDTTFPRETELIRDECQLSYLRLGACWRIVTAEHQPRRVVGSLIGCMVEWAHKHDLNRVLCEFNPHHEGFYRHFLGMEPVAYRDHVVGLSKKAAVILMQWDYKKVEAWSVLGKHMLPENPEI